MQTGKKVSVYLSPEVLSRIDKTKELVKDKSDSIKNFLDKAAIEMFYQAYGGIKSISAAAYLAISLGQFDVLKTMTESDGSKVIYTSEAFYNKYKNKIRQMFET